GICATCGVWIHEHIQPTHWHDKAADRFGYPRLSCQIRIVEDLTIELVDKIIWGKRQSSR
ncbi:MAG: (2Fe-2S)-binding protein, partial [Bacteroidota bacterium]